MGIKESVVERFGIPPEAAGEIRLTLSGKMHLCIEHHRGLLEYTGECIVVGCAKGSIRIIGEGLFLKAMEKECLVIAGRIISIDLE